MLIIIIFKNKLTFSFIINMYVVKVQKKTYTHIQVKKQNKTKTKNNIELQIEEAIVGKKEKEKTSSRYISLPAIIPFPIPTSALVNNINHLFG